MGPASTPDLRITALDRRFGDVVALDGASLEVGRGELVAVLGPSGCGKSTLLQLVAGHLEPDAGRIEVGGELVADAEAGTFVPAQRRGVGLVFQDYALFPHLTVAENVAYALREARRGPIGALGSLARTLVGGAQGRRRRAAADPQVREVLERIEIGELADRFPHELSGGQQQRVAIARALAQRPRLLLLDEPFCNLDASTREHVRGEIVEVLRATGLACVFVTHDQEEALAISDRVAVLQGGHVMQVDDPETLYRKPFCREVAEFLGRTNVLHGVATGTRVVTEVGAFTLAARADGDVQVLVRPELVDVRADPAGDAVVTGREFRGHDVLYEVLLDSGTKVFAHRPSVRMAGIGERVRLEAQPGLAALVEASPAPGSPAAVAREAAAFDDSLPGLGSPAIDAAAANVTLDR